MTCICPICGSGKFLTQQGNYKILCNNENCGWVGEPDDLNEGEEIEEDEI